MGLAEDLPALAWARVGAGFTQVAAPQVGVLEITIALLAAAAVTVLPVTWRFFALFVTLVHELGHACAGIMAGRFVTGIKLGFDHLGTTSHYGKLGGPGEVWCAFWGYPVPAVVGGALVWAGLSGWAPAALSAGSIVLLLTVLAIRNLAGLAITLGSSVVALSLVLFAPATTLALATVGLGLALLIGAVRDWVKVLSVHTQRPEDVETSDAHILSGFTGLPSPIWLGLFTVPIMGGWLLAGTLILQGLAGTTAQPDSTVPNGHAPGEYGQRRAGAWNQKSTRRLRARRRNATSARLKSASS